MSYIVNLPNGTILTTILDGTVDTSSSSLTLVGRNYSGYGEIIAEDLVALLVNFSNNVSPANPNTGQIWYDNSSNLVKVYTGSAWKNVGSATYASVSPSTTIGGDFWWDSTNKQLYCYDGTSPYNNAGWVLVGPGYNVIDGKGGAIVEQISDGTVWHNVVSMYVAGTRMAIISEDQFVPNVSIPGFGSTLQIGWNMSNTSTDGYIWGTANNASYLGEQPAANYFRKNINNIGTGTLTVNNNAGVTVGAFNQFVANITANNVSLQNTVTGSLNFTVMGNVALTVASNGQVLVNADPSQALGVATKQYVDNSFINANLWGVSTAVTAPVGTANTMIATTEFVVNNSGLYSYKIYQNNTHMWVSDADTGSANIVVDGTTVLSATSGGVVLANGATASTQGQTFNTSGNSLVATTQFVKTATTWWGGSAKFVSNVAPIAGVNDIGSNDGDFWFQYSN